MDRDPAPRTLARMVASVGRKRMDLLLLDNLRNGTQEWQDPGCYGDGRTKHTVFRGPER